MPFTELSASNFRNLSSYKIHPNRYNNLIIGPNGAGKTNLLESVYLNALGKSFRTGQPTHLIQNNKESCVVFSAFENGLEPKSLYRLGVERSKGKQQFVRINGKSVSSLSELALIAPTVVIQPQETQLIDGQASERRKYLDMLMFHVEPDFLSLWKKSQNILRQRNHLLKTLKHQERNLDSISKALEPWNEQFVASNEKMSDIRTNVFSWLKEDVETYTSRFNALLDGGSEITMGFYQGWDKSDDLSAVLRNNFEKDIARGFTLSGGHRADIRIKTNGVYAKDYLSRGQKKLLSMLMRLAQAKLLKERANKHAVLLLDDIYAELDENNTNLFIELVESLGLQAFFTCVSEHDRELQRFRLPTSVFHVEQGNITPKL